MAQFYQAIKGAAALGTPVGTIIPFSAASTPAGFLLCDGSAVSRTTYAALYAVIADTYGAGDGSTTFNVPDLAGKVPIGRDGVTYSEGGTGGSSSVTPTLTDNIAVTDNISVTDNIAVNKTGTVSVSSAVNGNPAKTGSATKTGSVSGNISGAPGAGNLAGSVSGNVSVNNTSLSTNQIASHRHTFTASSGGDTGQQINIEIDHAQGQFSVAPFTWNYMSNTGGGGSHSHGANLSANASINGAPSAGNLAVSVSDNTAVADNISVTAGTLAVSNTETDNIAVSKSGTVSKDGTVSKSGTVSSSSISTIQPYTAVRYAIKF